MSVYVDDMRAPFGRMVMCHMIADSTDRPVLRYHGGNGSAVVESPRQTTP